MSCGSSATEGTEEHVTLSNTSPYLSTYIYDGWNRLAGATVGTTTASYAYRGNNLRETKTVTTGENTKTIKII